MNAQVQVAWLKKLPGADAGAFAKMISYRTPDQFVELSLADLTEAQLDKLDEIARAENARAMKGAKGLQTKITAYKNVRADPTGKPIKRLEALVTALREYIRPSPNKWVFGTEKDGYAVPYFVSDIEFHPPQRQSPASVTMRLEAITRDADDDKTIAWHQKDLSAPHTPPRTAPELLNAEGYYLETPAAVAEYLADVEKHKEWSPLTGVQFSGTGTAFSAGRYSYGTTSLEREDQPARLVMDDAHGDVGADEQDDRKNAKPTSSAAFWAKPGARKDDDDEAPEPDGAPDDDGLTVATPVHPYVKVFDLERHAFYLTHVRNLAPYVYDKAAAEKLVLATDTKNLVTLLVEGSVEVMEDIVRGKTGGTIVIATGPPGTGKTLTAEVFSEKIERPLYVVQCSQLGTDETEVEKQLQLVLTRASRWRAILLIDEADVYVHERGSDIQQNAIVGVFLRVLEHYRGVLFLTSNRSTIIDDAIMSRATAWIRYAFPTREQLHAIWRVLAAQYGVTITDDLLGHAEGPAGPLSLLATFPKLSGRNVKNLLKLARMLLRARKRAEGPVLDEAPGVQRALPVPDLALFKYVAGFLDLEAKE